MTRRRAAEVAKRAKVDAATAAILAKLDYIEDLSDRVKNQLDEVNRDER